MGRMSKNGKEGEIHIQLPDIPPGARAIGVLPKGSVIYKLPPFTDYIVFHQNAEYPPKIITMMGELIDLISTVKPTVLK